MRRTRKMMTISNDNRIRVNRLIDKQTGEVLDLLNEAMEILHDTGDTESETLDQVMVSLKYTTQKLVEYRENEL
jgi:hypothetical protein